MVTEYVPAGAIENVLKVSVLLPEAGFGLMVVKTPGGGFKTNRKTALLKPPSGVIVIVLVAAEPCATDTLLGEAESKKSGEDETGALTVRLICVLCVKPHEQVAVTVTVNVPVDAEELAASVRVLEVAVALGLKEAVTPFGRPEAERVGLQANPFCGVIEIVLVPLEPCVIARLLGDAEIEKLAELEGPVHGDVPALTVRLIVVVCVIAIDKVLDDPVGALSAHGLAGIWGTLSCGLFTDPDFAKFNQVGEGGFVYTHRLNQLGAQALAVSVSFTTVFVSSFILFWIIKKTVGLRVSERHELDGLDISEHGMWGYPEQFMPVPGGAYIHPDAIAAPAHVTEARS